MVVQARLDEEEGWRELKDWRPTVHAGSPWNRCDEPGFGLVGVISNGEREGICSEYEQRRCGICWH